MASGAAARPIASSEASLLDQIKCQQPPRVARTINAMLENRLIRYGDNENGIYLFTPAVPLKFLGLTVTYIAGFDADDAFHGVPGSTTAGTAPPDFLEVDVAASVGELRKRALSAGLVEANTHERRRGFEVSAEGYGSYLAPRKSAVSSSIQCVR